MIKAGITSCILHLGILLVIINLTKIEIPKIADAGENIEVRIVSKNRGILTNPMEGNAPDNRKVDEAVDRSRNKEEKNDSIEKPPVKETPKQEPVKKEVVVKKIEKPKAATKPVAAASKESLEKIEKIEEEKKVEVAEEVVQAKIIQEPEAAEEKIEETADKNLAQGKKSPDSVEDSKKVMSDSKNQTKGTQQGDEGEDLIKLSDGSVMAKHQGIKGLSYGFVSNPEPDYPSRARRLGYKGDMVVKVIMEFDSSGKLQDMRFVEEEDKFGFRNEVRKAIEKWRLTPIKYNDIDVKMRFYKSFKFEKLN